MRTLWSRARSAIVRVEVRKFVEADVTGGSGLNRLANLSPLEPGERPIFNVCPVCLETIIGGGIID